MMRPSLAVTVAFCLGALAPAFAQTRDFSGVWLYEPSKSETAYSKPVGRILTVVDERSRVTVTLSKTGLPIAIEKYSCTTDGAATRAASGPESVTWTLRREGQTLVWHGVRTANNASIGFTERWSLSPDGNTLTVDRVYAVSPEAAATHPERSQIKEVFTKQPSRKR